MSFSKKMNCKLDLAAIEAHLLIIRPGNYLEVFVVTILGWAREQRGAPPPFLEYWGGCSPPSPLVPTPMYHCESCTCVHNYL